MERDIWDKTVNSLLDKCLVQGEKRIEISEGLSCARTLLELAEKNISGTPQGYIHNTWQDLADTARDAIAQLVIQASSGKLVMMLDAGTGKYTYGVCDIPIQDELDILTGNKM